MARKNIESRILVQQVPLTIKFFHLSFLMSSFDWNVSQFMIEPLYGVLTMEMQLIEQQVVTWDLVGQPGEDSSFTRFWDTLEEMVGEMRNRTEESFPNVIDQMRFGLAIRGERLDGSPIDIYVKYLSLMNANNADAIRRILNQVATVLQSADALSGRLRFVFTAWQARNDMQLNGKKYVGFTGDVSAFLMRKPGCCVCVTQECFLELLTLGLSYLMHPVLQTVEYSDIAKKRKRQWEQLRREAMEKIRRHIADVSDGIAIRWNDVQQTYIQEVERCLNVRIVLLNVAHALKVEYAGLDAPWTIYGVVSEPVIRGDDIIWGHVDFIQEAEDLCQEGNKRQFRWCNRCLSKFRVRKACTGICSKTAFERRDAASICTLCHTCAGSCICCGRSDCPAEQPICCHLCQLNCKSNGCLTRHLAECCPRRVCRRCNLCGLGAHEGFACDEYKCGCGQVLKRNDEQHECWVQSLRLKPPSEKIGVYDFECGIAKEGVHFPYLLTLWFPYEDPCINLFEEYAREVQDLENPVYVFFGDSALNVFADQLSNAALKKYCLFAHNAKSYDHHFIEKYLRERSFPYEKTCRGRKVLEMIVKSNKLTFRDSVSFIPAPLRTFSKSFGIRELAKGHFPHSIVSSEFLERWTHNPIIEERPSIEHYLSPFSIPWGKAGQQYREELQAWYDSMPTSWNFQEEAEAYCISDTVLLGKALVKFRESMMELTDELHSPRPLSTERIQLLDPLTYMTLPSAVMKYFLSQMMPKESIGVIDRWEVELQVSSVEWLLVQLEKRGLRQIIMASEGVNILRNFKKDRSATIGNCYFVYADCFDNGCEKCLSPGDYHPRSGSRFADRRVRFMQRLSNSDREVVLGWQCEWKEQRKQFSELFSIDFQRWIPLKVRDAYKGGKVEAYMIYNSQGSVQGEDVVSLYPSVMFGEHYDPFSENGGIVETPFPVGHPIKLFRPENFSLQPDDVGCAKVLVLPPRNLFAPLLSYRVKSRFSPSSEEIIYGLCRTCMEDRIKQCYHEEHERAFIGTWTLPELVEAQRIGYLILEWIDVWRYPAKKVDLFRKLLSPFVRAKICAKKDGLVENGEFTDRGREVKQFVEQKLSEGTELLPSMIEDAPVKRTVAKLTQNSFYGKLGQNEVQECSKIFFKSESAKCLSTLTNPRYDIRFVELLGGEKSMCAVSYQEQMISVRSHFFKNDMLAAHVTGYARRYLNRIERSLGYSLTYVDTDSAYHTEEGVGKYHVGYRMGDMEPDQAGINEWAGCGRKFYMYRKGEDVQCKLKGVMLKESHRDVFNLESIRQTMRRMRELEISEDVEGIVVPQQLFVTETERDQGMPIKRTRTSLKKTRMDVGKRVVLWPGSVDPSLPFASSDQRILTVPYGFLNNETLL